jgi:tetratricopeptide (TPR) repeat protein
MYRRIKQAGTAIIAACTLSGCSILPSPSSTITAPQSVIAKSAGDKNMMAVVKKFLPKGATLLAPASSQNEGAIQRQDLSGDGISEIIASYKTGNAVKEPGILVLKQKNGEWTKAWEQKGPGYDLDMVRFADITGEGHLELLVGRTLGASAGKGLDIFTWNSGELQKLGSLAYHKIDLVFPSTDTPLFTVWQRDLGDAYKVDVLRWEKTRFISVYEDYPLYLREAVSYHEQKVKEMPDAAFYHYYLADAQIKAAMPEQALQSARKGRSLLKADYPAPYQFQIIEGEALYMLKKYTNARETFLSLLRAPQITEQEKTAVLYYMGQTYSELKQYKKAKESLEHSIGITKNSEKQEANSLSAQALSAQKALYELPVRAFFANLKTNEKAAQEQISARLAKSFTAAQFGQGIRSIQVREIIQSKKLDEQIEFMVNFDVEIPPQSNSPMNSGINTMFFTVKKVGNDVVIDSIGTSPALALQSETPII